MKTITSPAGRIHLVQVHAATYRGFHAATTTWCGIRTTASWTGGNDDATCGTCRSAQDAAGAAPTSGGSGPTGAEDQQAVGGPSATPGQADGTDGAPGAADGAGGTPGAADGRDDAPGQASPSTAARVTLARPRLVTPDAAAGSSAPARWTGNALSPDRRRPDGAPRPRPVPPPGVPRDGVDWSMTPGRR